MKKKKEEKKTCPEPKCKYKAAPSTLRRHLNTAHGIKQKPGPPKDPDSAEIKKKKDRERYY